MLISIKQFEDGSCSITIDWPVLFGSVYFGEKLPPCVINILSGMIPLVFVLFLKPGLSLLSNLVDKFSQTRVRTDILAIEDSFFHDREEATKLFH